MKPKTPNYNEEYARHLEYAELMKKNQDESHNRENEQKNNNKKTK